ncbi:MAG: cell division protein FtsH, partial [Synergistaceae bacterium]|nr:cell division protein FtsH [Synergistaceae bacterium]
EVRRIVDECFERVQGILNDNFVKVEEITAILLEKEVLEGAEFNKLLGFPDKDEDAEKNGGKQDGPEPQDVSDQGGPETKDVKDTQTA